VHWEYGLVVFRLTMQELLNTEQFYQKKFNKIKKKYFKKKFEVSFWYWKALDEWGF